MRKLFELFLSFALLSLFQSTVYAASYTIIDLGPMVTPVTINNKSVITGYKTTPDGHRTAFYYSRRAMHDLGTFNGTDSEALDVNSSGVIVGTFTQNGARRGFKLTGSGFTDLFATAGMVEAVGINDGGAILGSVRDPVWGTRLPVILQNGVAKDISAGMSREESMDCSPVRLNNLGEAAFYQVFCGSWECENSYLYRNPTTVDILPVPFLAHHLNNNSQVVGRQIVSWFVLKGVIYRNGVLTTMNDFGGDQTNPTAINDLGQVVGKAQKPNSGVFSAFRYQNGAMVDLNTLLPDGSGWDLSSDSDDTVADINNYGQIVGKGMLNGEERAFLFSPQYTASGTVRVGSATGPPLAGATVSIGGSTATTSGTGYFSIAGILPGTYNATVNKSGYVTTTTQLTVSKDLSGLVFSLAPVPTYYLGGTVRAGSGTGPALPGVTVSIAGKSVVTGSTGAFTITGIPAGTYTLTLQKSGYVKKTYSGYTVSCNRTGLVFYLVPAPTYTISGTVRTGRATGAVLPGATVAIAGKSAVTGSTGTFSISGIAAGNYTLTIYKTGYQKKTYSGYAITGNRTGLVFYLVPATAASSPGRGVNAPARGGRVPT